MIKWRPISDGFCAIVEGEPGYVWAAVPNSYGGTFSAGIAKIDKAKLGDLKDYVSGVCTFSGTCATMDEAKDICEKIRYGFEHEIVFLEDLVFIEPQIRRM